jgi:hypothetical protein
MATSDSGGMKGHGDRTWNSDFGIWWQTDSSTSECNVCQSAFHLMKRRHHCRFCGTPPTGANAHHTSGTTTKPLPHVHRLHPRHRRPMLHYLAHPHNLCQWRHSSTLPLITSDHLSPPFLTSFTICERGIPLCNLALTLSSRSPFR